MKSPTQQAIIFLLEEYIREHIKFTNKYEIAVVTSGVIKARELLEEVKAEDIHNDPELEGRL